MGVQVVEDWKPISGYDGFYEVSSLGNIRSLERQVSCHKKFSRTLKPRQIKKILKTTGYEQVTLQKYSLGNICLVHRIVAESFINNPESKPQVNHKDGNKANNAVTNLEWCTPSENGLHAYRELGIKSWSAGHTGADTPTAKPVLQMSMSGEIVRRWECASDAVRELGFDSGCISRAAHGIAAHHMGFRWKYVER